MAGDLELLRFRLFRHRTSLISGGWREERLVARSGWSRAEAAVARSGWPRAEAAGRALKRLARAAAGARSGGVALPAGARSGWRAKSGARERQMRQ
jgi:hypothetical protein